MIHKCDICKYETKYKSHLTNHFNSQKHKKIKEIQDSKELINKTEVKDDYENKDFYKYISEKLSAELMDSDSDTNKIHKCKKCMLEFNHRHNMLRHTKTCNFDKLTNYIKNKEDYLDKCKCPICELQCLNKGGFVKHTNVCITNKIKEDNNPKSVQDNKQRQIELLILENKLLREKEDKNKEEIKALLEERNKCNKQIFEKHLIMNEYIQKLNSSMIL
jgi:hypothetical protein